MPLYVLLCVCICVLTFSGVLETAGEAMGLSSGAFIAGALIVLVSSLFEIRIATLNANAASILWPVFWAIQSENTKTAFSRLYSIAAWTPLFAAFLWSVIQACTELYFAPVLDERVLNMEILLWGCCVYTETLFYINNRKTPIKNL